MTILAIAFLHLLALALGYLSKSRPNSKATRWLFGSVGPRTDTKDMTEPELFGASRYFITNAAYFALIFIAIIKYANPFASPAPAHVGLLLFFLYLSMFLSLLGMLGFIACFSAGMMRRQSE